MIQVRIIITDGTAQPPRFEPLKIGVLVSRVASLETRLPVNVVSGPDVLVRGDDAARGGRLGPARGGN